MKFGKAVEDFLYVFLVWFGMGWLGWFGWYGLVCFFVFFLVYFFLKKVFCRTSASRHYLDIPGS